jgi:hypothetical protein
MARERADREYVAVLHLAALNGESAVEETLNTLLERDEGFDAERVRQMVQPQRAAALGKRAKRASGRF